MMNKTIHSSKTDYFKGNFKIATIIGIFLSTFGLIFYTIGSKEMLSFSDILISFIISMLISYVFYFSNAFVYDLLEKKFKLNWKDDPIPKLILGLLINCAICLVLGSMILIIIGLTKGYSFQDTINWLFSSQSSDAIQRMLWISMTVTISLYIFYYIKEVQKEKANDQKHKIKQLSSEQEALKSNIGPHFLFNSLNVLNGLITENPEKAQDFVSELSTIYRYVLEQKDLTVILLKDEIEFAENYLNLITKRLEDSIRYTINVNQSIQETYYLVPLSLQIVLENCIKHNKATDKDPLNINIYFNNNYLVIENNLNLKSENENSLGIGLKSIISRYGKITEKPVGIKETANLFIIELPLVRLNEIQDDKTVNQYTEKEYEKAKKKVKEKKRFMTQFMIYLVVIPFLFLVNWLQGIDYWWAFWPMIGWGFALLLKYVKTFGLYNSREWEQKEMDKELKKWE